MVHSQRGVRSLRSTFLLSILVLFLVLTGASLLVFRSTYRDITDNYIQLFAQSQSLLQKHRILTIMEREAVLSQRMSQDTLVKLWARNEDNPEIRQQALEQLESYRQFFRDQTFFLGFAESRNYYLAESAQQELLFRNLDPEHPADRWFFETLRSERDFWINVDYSVVLNQVKVWFNTLMRESDGSILGITGTGMDVTLFLEEVVENSPLGINPIILNTQGDILAHRDRSLVMYNSTVSRNEDRITFWSLVDELSAEAVEAAFGQLRDAQDAADNDRVFTFNLDWEDKPVTLAASYIPQLDWYSVVMVDPTTVIALGRFLPLVQVILAALVIISVLVFLLISRLVLRPLDLLIRASRSVAQGDYSQPPVYQSRDEFGLLAQSFASMTLQIQDYTSNLEQLVQVRTRELQASQERIQDSLRYSQLIQRSIMPSREELDREMAESFLIHRPLEQVGGDYAFFRPVPGGFCLAVIDCTGHGVPGALMTMLVHASLNRILDTRPGAGPAEILGTLHELVQHSLRASADLAHVENGLDIGLCLFNRQDQELQFCGGGLPLVARSPSGLVWYPSSRVRLGFRSRSKALEFRVHRIPVTADSSYFLFSDGLLDLPVVPRGFGMGNKGVEELLLGRDSRNAEESGLEAEGRRIITSLDAALAQFPPKDDLILVGFRPYLTDNLAGHLPGQRPDQLL